MSMGVFSVIERTCQPHTSNDRLDHYVASDYIELSRLDAPFHMRPLRILMLENEFPICIYTCTFNAMKWHIDIFLLVRSANIYHYSDYCRNRREWIYDNKRSPKIMINILVENPPDVVRNEKQRMEGRQP